MGSTRKDTFTQIAFSVVFLLAFLAAFKLRIKHLFQTLICRISLKMHFQLRFTHVVTAFTQCVFRSFLEASRIGRVLAFSFSSMCTYSVRMIAKQNARVSIKNATGNCTCVCCFSCLQNHNCVKLH